MKQLNRYLLTVLGLGWLSFLIAAILLNQVFAVPNFVLLIERSYCPPQQWQQVVQEYTKLYRQHQQLRIEIESVVLFNDLGEEVLAAIPTPEELRAKRTYGRASSQREAKLRTTYEQFKIIRCF
ncbi:MAG: hypothetical protein QNJ38_10680 [Prochloraceae cyanobacterium]|nr:hypothetical protein [Prochloraceae cyanobacterium]